MEKVREVLHRLFFVVFTSSISERERFRKKREVESLGIMPMSCAGFTEVHF
jgi:hypothetical protein